MSVGAVVACCALTTACTQEAAQTRSPSPRPAAATPSESQMERKMRLDFEAAEEAYRTNMAEQDRLYKAGGAVEATPVLKATASICDSMAFCLNWSSNGFSKRLRN